MAFLEVRHRDERDIESLRLGCAETSNFASTCKVPNPHALSIARVTAARRSPATAGAHEHVFQTDVTKASMLVEAYIENAQQAQSVSVSTNGVTKVLSVPARPGGGGSTANGGELLCLALATCYCNDIYREAAKRNIVVVRVEVHARAEFDLAGEPAKSLRYGAMVEARASESEIRELMAHTDRIAEIQGTLRQGMEVLMEAAVAKSLA